MNSKLKKSKPIILLLDIFGFFLFLIPLLAERIFRKKKSQSFKNILLIELWGIGDLIILSTILRPLRDKFPNARISLLSKSYGKIIFKEHTYIDQYIDFDFPWTRFRGKYELWSWSWAGLIRIISKLRKEKFDLILDARGDFRNNVLSFVIGAERRLGYTWTGGSYFLTDTPELDYKNRHRVDAWVGLLDLIELKVTSPKPNLDISDKEVRWTEDYLESQGVKKSDLLIGIHPGARIKTRCWPKDRFAKLAEYLKDNYTAQIIVFEEPQGYGGDILIKNDFIKVKPSLREMMVLIKHLTLFICNDGGPMHIATALNTPVVAIFGPTNPDWFGPLGDRKSIVIKNDIKCRPCFDYCRFTEPICLDRISIDEVIKATEKMLSDLGINPRREIYERIYWE